MTTRTISSNRYYAGALVILAASLSLVGCDDAYSTQVQYALRTDPLVMSEKIGDEQVDPDRPGVFPIMAPKDLLNPVNPMYPKRDALFATDILRDPTLISGEQEKPGNKLEIKALLDEWFGTPRDPRVQEAPTSLDLDDKKLADGSKLYRLHCLHCHGVNGDGRGVTAKWINPHPRDFRQGLFKFQSVDQVNGPMPSPPRREDLKRTLLAGIEGTAMPAFNLLAPKEIDALVSYVIHLSIRGQVEYDTIRYGYVFNKAENSLDYDEDNPPLDQAMRKTYDKLLQKWVKSQSRAIAIKPYPYPEGVNNDEFKASVKRGYNYFIGNITETTPEAKALNCVSCHVNFGRAAMFKWDNWGTLVRPNNITNGIYRGGRRTVDIYYRIHSGINGSNMPAFGLTETTNPKVVWDLVNFVQSVPFPGMREKLGIPIE